MKKLNETLLEVKNLNVFFHIGIKKDIHAVNNVSFKVDKGSILGIIGESGSGKSTVAYSIINLLPDTATLNGSIKFKEKELINLSFDELQEIRGYKIGFIPQNPMTSLDPSYTIGKQLEEVIYCHLGDRINKIHEEYKLAYKEYKTIKEKYNDNENNLDLRKSQEKLKAVKDKKENFLKNKIIEVLNFVGINKPEERLKQYPHELSGGMLQRVIIAMSLICEPDLLIADEPTTALDVTIQKQILDLLKNIKQKLNLSIIIITHDLGVITKMCDYINVMYAGKIIEKGTKNEILYNPKHEYTKSLINSIPDFSEETNTKRLKPIKGNPINLLHLPDGCSFAPRCESCMEICLKKYPEMFNINENHETSCFKYALESYQKKEISDKDFKSIIENSKSNNSVSNKDVSYTDVYNSYQCYQNDLQKYKLSIKNLELKKQKDKSKLNYLSIKKKFKISLKNEIFLRDEKQFIEKFRIKNQIEKIKEKFLLIEEKNYNFNYLKEFLMNIDLVTNYQLCSEKEFLESKEKYRKLKIKVILSFFKMLIRKISKLEWMKLLCEYYDAKKIYLDRYEQYKFFKKINKNKKKLYIFITEKIKDNIEKKILENKNLVFEKVINKEINFKNEKEIETFLNNFSFANWNFQNNFNQQNRDNILKHLKEQEQIIKNKVNTEELKKLNEFYVEYFLLIINNKINIYYQKVKKILFKNISKILLKRSLNNLKYSG